MFNKTVLDIGCGGGILSESLAEEGAIVTGLDVSQASLQVAKDHARNKRLKINYVCQTAEAHSADSVGVYDVVACMEVLEHVPHPHLVVQACAKMVKPGGHVFFSTINRTLQSWLLVVFSAEYLLHLIPRGTHDVSRFIKPAELIGWLDTTSLHARHITGVNYNLFLDRFRLNSAVKVNYMLHSQSD